MDLLTYYAQAQTKLVQAGAGEVLGTERAERAEREVEHLGRVILQYQVLRLLTQARAVAILGIALAMLMVVTEHLVS
jgi:hypothetical protein